MSLPRSARWAASVVVASLALVACFGDTNAQQSPTPDSSASASQQSAPPPAMVGTHVLPDFAPLVEQYGSAVVNVEVVQKVETTGNPSSGDPRGLSPDDPFYDFFRRFGIPSPNGPRGNPMPARGAGSGFIVTHDGYVLTNAHVVNNAGEVTVRLNDRREFAAKVVGADTTTDVAVLKIDAHDLPIVRVGDPEKLKPGEWVIAIGSPFGFENSVTAGIVSATARSLPQDTTYVPFIQTDVAVNPGNSGGPLFNMRGEVVGINSQIYSQTGGYMGLSFAIPIDVAMNVQDQLIKTGHVVRGRIGVTIQELNAQLAESFGLDRPHGALVSSVEGDSPADKAGLKSGDVILDVNGTPVERSTALSSMISRMKPGTNAKLGVWRAAKRSEINVKVGEFDQQQQRVASRTSPDRGQTDHASALGLSVRPLAPEERKQVETEGNIVVEQVTGPAAAAGVRPGDIILGVNGSRVKSVEDLQNATKKSGKSVALLIQRDDAQIFVPIRLG